MPSISMADSYQTVAANAVMKGYANFWPVPTVHAVEKEIETKVDNASILTKLDAIVTTEGELLVNELKTTSLIGESFWAKKETDIQPTMYILAARAAGYDVDGCQFDVVRRPAAPKNGETPLDYGARLVADIKKRPEFYYERRTFYRTLDRIDKDMRNVAEIYEAIKLREVLGAASEHKWYGNPAACFDFNKKCEFHPVCHGEELIHASSLYRKRDYGNNQSSVGEGEKVQ